MENVELVEAHTLLPGQPLSLDSPPSGRGQVWEFSSTSRLLHSLMVSEHPLCVHVLLGVYRGVGYMYRSYVCNKD